MVTTSDTGLFAPFQAHRCQTSFLQWKPCNHAKCVRPLVAESSASRTVCVVATKRSCGRANGSSFQLLSYAVNPKLVLRNEPISRGGGSKPHMCQFLYRTGGELVYVCQPSPARIDRETNTRRFLTTNSEARSWDWSQMQRDASAYVCGRVWHPDHKTVVLDGWHRVLMNTENLAPGARAVVFLD